jgi:beta-galactosidase
VIAGVDNADLKDYEQYVGNTRKAWKGRASVVIRSTHGAGNIELRVTVPGLSKTTLNIKSVTK